MRASHGEAHRAAGIERGQRVLGLPVVPKVFVLFDVGRDGKAEPGTRYKSRLHKIDNLQAAHTYCNKRKANTPEVDKWRHPAMPPLTVADAEDGGALVLPRESKARSAR